MAAKCVYHHLQGAHGLSEALHRSLDAWEALDEAAKRARRPLFVFDFDRTLTNGFAEPGQGLERRVRGGQATLDALGRAKALGAGLFVVTARAPTRLTIEQLEASLLHCQEELFGVFCEKEAASGEEYRVEKVDGRYLAWRGRLFASDYSKPIAVHQILSEITAEHDDGSQIELHFFDDFVMNAFDVGAGTYGPRVSPVAAYWWDTFMEEKEGMIGPVLSFSSDFPYQEQCIPALAAFGLVEDESKARRDFYLDREAKLNIKPRAKEEIAPPLKLDEGLKSSLGSMLAGLKPRMPPPS